ncbi:hypothetical protein EVAR_14542_1 [Eumeta japonica]|uniref:Uncharacterized protein n=1 Tax=Eumeta variegata TaxID=151549 RepID=A0A4C1U4Q5_EUMVA|nr:hypothetical protein EVAR_14542_1 [Eumeta japonica]
MWKPKKVPIVPPSRLVAFGPVPWTPFSLVCYCVCSVSLSRVPECRASCVYECVWYRAVFSVRSQQATCVRPVCSLRFTAPSARRARARFLRDCTCVHFRRITLPIPIAF